MISLNLEKIVCELGNYDDLQTMEFVNRKLQESEISYEKNQEITDFIISDSPFAFGETLKQNYTDDDLKILTEIIKKVKEAKA